MAVTPLQKALRELDGGEAAEVAWSLLEWVRLADNLVERNGLLSAYDALLNAGKPPTSGSDATIIQRRIAFKLTHLIAELEGRQYGLRQQGDRAWIVDTFAECLDATMGCWVAKAAPPVDPSETATAPA